MNKNIENYQFTQPTYLNKLSSIGRKIKEEIKHVVKDVLEGRVSLEHYHDWEINTVHNTYFEVDEDGYGRELEADTVVVDENGEIGIYLSDGEDVYKPYWKLSDMTTTDALYLLEELESVIEYLKETGEDVVTEYNPDLS